MEKKVELLAPAGDLEKLKFAVLYGADAVYLGGNAFGLRAKAKNFDLKDMEEGVNFAHSHNVKVYVVCNIFAHNADFSNERFENYIKDIARIGVDGVLVADPGLFTVIKKTVPNLDIHISTQANITNYQTALFWKDLGATRVVLAREMSFKEINTMVEKINGEIEIEAFVHGAMCMAYSGRCLISNYMTGRDSNKGACSQSCRWNYSVVEETRPGEYYPIEEDERGTYLFNAKDLCMISYIPELVQSGIYSFKIEGRAKSPFYLATVVKTYRQAIDDYLKDPALYESKKDYYYNEIMKASHRGYTTGFYFNKPKSDAHIYSGNSYVRLYDFIGVVREYDAETGFAIIEQRNKFVVGDEIEFLTIEGDFITQKIEEMYDFKTGEPIMSAPHAQQIVKLKVLKPVKPYELMRKPSDNPVTIDE